MGATVEENKGGVARRIQGPRGGLVAGLMVLLLVGVTGWLLFGRPPADPSGQLETDCVRDQQAIAGALANADLGSLRDAVTGNAILELTDQVSAEQSSGLRIQDSPHLSSIQVIQATDPNDSSITQAVEEKGVLTRTMTAGGVQSSQQQVNFDDKYWLRVPAGSRYAIADRLVAEQPIPEGTLPLLWVAGGAVLVTIAATMLMIRERSRRVTAATLGPALASVPFGKLEDGPEPSMRIETLGGLHVWVDGADLAPKLKRHPMLCFIWLWLLLRAVHFERPSMAKADLADEAWPGSDPRTQAGRMRVRLSQIRKRPPPEVGAVGVGKRHIVRFDPPRCRVEVVGRTL